MKIAYVVLLQHSNTGIERTLAQKAKSLETLGCDNFDILVLSPDPIIGDSPRLRHILLRRGPLAWWLFRLLFRRYRIIETNVDLSDYDRVLLRYAAGDPTGPAFMARFPVWTEHHTLELEELAAKLKDARSPVVRQLKRLRLWLERRYATAILSHSRGLIGVTDEILSFERGRVTRSIPGVTISNGIDVEGTPPTGFRPFDGHFLDMVAVASSNAPWHGVDRVVGGMHRYRGDVRLRLHLVGDFYESELGRKPGPQGQLVFHGTLKGAELDRVLSSANLALSTLAISRKGMHEACSLKTREYMARGMPFVYGYSDPDLSSMERDQLPFGLRVTDDDTPLSMHELLAYASQIADTAPPEQLSATMRAYAQQHMDWKIKMRCCVDFLSGVNWSRA